LPALAEVPVVILTSSESPRDRLEAERLGTSGFFRKPIELQEFMSMGRRIAELFGM
jgi:CheY-like chemotaxis protein